MKIREDLVGIVTVVDSETGFVTILRAGDEVPDGVTVGEHVLIGFDASLRADGEITSESTPKPRGRAQK